MITQLHKQVAGVITGVALLVSLERLGAQGTMQALNFAPPGVAGYTTNGVGWSFVPTSDLLVTAISATAPQIDFWQGNGQLLAIYAYSGSYGSIPTGPSTNFQSVQPLLLTAGQTYFISAQSSNFSVQVGFFYFSQNGAGGLTSFAPSSDITGFASYYLSPNGQWSSPFTPTSDNLNYALLGPNFEYQVVPEPGSFGLFLIGVGICCSRRASSRKKPLSPHFINRKKSIPVPDGKVT
jgi:PEP-CTERM motif